MSSQLKEPKGCATLKKKFKKLIKYLPLLLPKKPHIEVLGFDCWEVHTQLDPTLLRRVVLSQAELSSEMATLGRLSSVVNIAEARPCLRVMTTVLAWNAVAPVLLSKPVPDGEQSRPEFYSLLLFSHHSCE